MADFFPKSVWRGIFSWMVSNVLCRRLIGREQQQLVIILFLPPPFVLCFLKRAFISRSAGVVAWQCIRVLTRSHAHTLRSVQLLKPAQSALLGYSRKMMKMVEQRQLLVERCLNTAQSVPRSFLCIYIVLTFHLTKLDAGASSSSARSVSFLLRRERRAWRDVKTRLFSKHRDLFF